MHAQAGCQGIRLPNGCPKTCPHKYALRCYRWWCLYSTRCFQSAASFYQLRGNACYFDKDDVKAAKLNPAHHRDGNAVFGPPKRVRAIIRVSRSASTAKTSASLGELTTMANHQPVARKPTAMRTNRRAGSDTDATRTVRNILMPRMNAS